MKLLTQIFLAFLISLKIVFGSILLFRGDIKPPLAQNHALASEVESTSKANPREGQGTVGGEELELSYILKKRAELRKEQEILAKKKAELLTIQEEIEKKINILSRLRDEIRAEVAKKKAMEDQKFKHLIKAYSSMKPQKAADLIEKLDIKFSVDLLSRMKGDQVGKILSFVETERAAKITEGLAKRR
ncbi:MAG: hypothetical protein JRJ03_13980 [Deltaproteobacteria bacterium]|nr:hypothetical protein [Deltaproteobacteria bacterium]